MSKAFLVVVVLAVLVVGAVPAFAQTPPIMTDTADSLLESVLQFIADSGLGVIVAAGAIIGLFGLVMRRLKGAVR
jgi:type II secretory pathway component PulF